MIAPVTDERSLAAARALIRAHFEAHSQVHDPAEIRAVIDRLPAPYVPPSGGLWVSWEGDLATGCVALQPLSEETGEVKRMYVNPSFRGRGIARALAKLVIDEARALTVPADFFNRDLLNLEACLVRGVRDIKGRLFVFQLLAHA